MNFRERVKFAADQVGGLNRLAEIIGIARRTLGDQLSNKTEPKVSLLIAIQRATGFSVQWLATGEGEMFTSAAATPAGLRTVDPAIFKKIAARIEDLYKELKINPTKAEISEITAELYNEILIAETDLNDPDELDPAIAVQIARLKRGLSKDTNNPKSAIA